MNGFPNLDAVERHVHGGTAYEPLKTNIPAPPQQKYAPQFINRTIAPEAPAIPSIEIPPAAPSQETATIMLSDTQFERLLETTASQQPGPSPAPAQMVTLPIAPINTGLVAAVSPNGAGNGIAEFGSNVVDLVGNITFGTVNRAGKTITTLIDNMIDIITFGYGMHK